MIAETSGKLRGQPQAAQEVWSSLWTPSRPPRQRRCFKVLAAESRHPSGGRGGSDLARLETAVPVDQRPSFQLKETPRSAAVLMGTESWLHD